jgi:hypothetical protein
VRCKGESASIYGFGNDTATYNEAGEVRGQGGVDGAEGESASPIALENSPVNNSVDDGYAMIGVDEGLLKNLLIKTYEPLSWKLLGTFKYHMVTFIEHPSYSPTLLLLYVPFRNVLMLSCLRIIINKCNDCHLGGDLRMTKSALL